MNVMRLASIVEKLENTSKIKFDLAKQYKKQVEESLNRARLRQEQRRASQAAKAKRESIVKPDEQSAFASLESNRKLSPHYNPKVSNRSRKTTTVYQINTQENLDSSNS